MKLSVLIVTWNSARDVEACLDSVGSTHEQETIVVDNASTDPTPALLARYPWAVRIMNPKNLGYARASNQALKLAQGEYLLFLNPDTKLEPGAIDALVRHLDTHHGHAAVAPRLVDYDEPGRTQLSVRNFPTPARVFFDLLGLSRLFSRNRTLGGWRMAWFDYEHEGPVPQPMTSCLLLRRSIFEQLGQLDERFPIFYNDVDLSLRMSRAGLVTWYRPDVRVRHRRGASTTQVRPKMIWESHRSLIRFLHKHDPNRWFWLKAVILLPLSEIVALARVIAWRLSRLFSRA